MEFMSTHSGASFWNINTLQNKFASHNTIKMPLSLERWQGQVAIVTGASSGIGAAIAKNLASEGLKVVGLARRSERIEELAKTIKSKKGKLYAFKADVSKEEDILKAFAFAKTLGPIHILVNNAGFANVNSLADGDTHKWRVILDVNVLGLSIATREAVRDMRKNNVDGHIIHINSLMGHKIVFPYNMYGPSKFAVTALTETLRQELVALGSKIKITVKPRNIKILNKPPPINFQFKAQDTLRATNIFSISPGFVMTEVFGLFDKDPAFAKRMEEEPHAESEDIADAVSYVLSTPPHVQIHELTIKPVGEKF